MWARGLATAALDALFLLTPWAAYAGLLAHHGSWGGYGGLGDTIEVGVGCVAADVLIVLIDGVLLLARKRTLGIGLLGPDSARQASSLSPPSRHVAGGIAVDTGLLMALFAPLAVALTDFDRLEGAAAGTGATLLALLAIEAVMLATTRGTLGMRALR